MYDRALLLRYRDTIAAGKWENYLHDAMHRDGVPMVLRPEIGVGHKKHYTVGEYLSQRFLYARSYAGERVKGMPLAKRLAYGAAAFALPPLLMYRTVARVLAKRRYRMQLLAIHSAARALHRLVDRRRGRRLLDGAGGLAQSRMLSWTSLTPRSDRT